MKEYLIEERLNHWLTANGCNVLYNRKIKQLGNVHSFSTKGEGTERPDMLVFSKQIGFIAIEIKDGDEERKIYDGNKILEYQKQYVEKKVKYYVKGNEIPISLFLMASQNSVNGKLFTKEEEMFFNDTKYVGHPDKEYSRSGEYVRNLWGAWRNRREKGEPGIGILLSRTLDNEETKPMAFCQLYYNNRWNVIWTPL